MDQPESHILTWLGRSGYAFALYLVAAPLITVGSGNWPFQFTEFRWRYDGETMLSGFMVAIVMGFFLASVIALGRRHRRTLKAFAVVNILAAIGALLINIDYVLNGLQLRQQVNLDRMRSFELVVVRGAVIYFFGALLLIWFGMVSYRASKQFTLEMPPETGGHPLVSI